MIMIPVMIMQRGLSVGAPALVLLQELAINPQTAEMWAWGKAGHSTSYRSGETKTVWLNSRSTIRYCSLESPRRHRIITGNKIAPQDITNHKNQENHRNQEPSPAHTHTSPQLRYEGLWKGVSKAIKIKSTHPKGAT